jgi:hypothetical protein
MIIMNTKPWVFFTFIIIAAALMAGCVQSGSAAGTTPQPTTADQGGATPRITLADNGKMVTYTTGQTFLLYLGEEYNWSLSISDQNVISRVKNIAVIRGAQGVYDVLQAGTTILTAVGDPICRDQQPACAAPSIQFQVTIVVK